MAQVKIYTKKGISKERKRMLSDAIHESLMETLALPADKKFQRFMLLESEDFIYPDDRGNAYMIIELIMFEGRSTETKKELIRTLIKKTTDALDVEARDIEITIIETPKSNWGIRGLPGDELDLNYKVEI
jgi:4-oxalocrotonate tautomerase family enzyme